MDKGKRLHTLAIVLNWQQPQVTLACVDALLRLQNPNLDILVIDNGSGDESVEILKASDALFELLELPENVGFAAGNNRGLGLAIERGYEYALLINNDAFAGPQMLERLLAQTADDVALVSPKIYYDSDPNRIWFAGGTRHPLTLDMRDTGLGESDGPRYGDSKDVDYLVGACLLVNLQAARVVGLLDESYFFYFEDMDWSLRFTEAGYRLRLAADAHCYHRVALSTGGEEDSAQRRYFLAYGSVLFWKRNAHFGNTAVITAFRMISAAKMVTRLLMMGNRDIAAAYLRGLRDGWRETERDRHTTGLPLNS